MENQLFWLFAIVDCLLAFGFAVRHRSVSSTRPDPECSSLLKGQEKDNWLTCAVVWIVILLGDWGGQTALQWLGAALLAWTSWRSARRLALLPRRPG